MVLTPEQFILKHALQPYDAAKRREYYLKTRELKGRLGSGKLTPSKELRTAVQKPTGLKIAPKAPTSNREEIQRKREEVKARVDALNKKLDRLREILKGLKSGKTEEKPEEDKGKEKDKKRANGCRKERSSKRSQRAQRQRG